MKTIILNIFYDTNEIKKENVTSLVNYLWFMDKSNHSLVARRKYRNKKLFPQFHVFLTLQTDRELRVRNCEHFETMEFHT